MTEAERAVVCLLAAAWNAFRVLPDATGTDANDFCNAIHQSQRVLATLVARRADPDLWTKE